MQKLETTLWPDNDIRNLPLVEVVNGKLTTSSTFKQQATKWETENTSELPHIKEPININEDMLFSKYLKKTNTHINRLKQQICNLQIVLCLLPAWLGSLYTSTKSPPHIEKPSVIPALFLKVNHNNSTQRKSLHKTRLCSDMLSKSSRYSTLK